MFELLQHNSGYYGHYRSRIRNDFMNEYRQRAKPQPPQKYLDRSKVSLHHHVMFIARSLLLLLLYCWVTDIMVVSQWELSDNWELLSPVTTLIEFVGCWRKGRRSLSSTPPSPTCMQRSRKLLSVLLPNDLHCFIMEQYYSTCRRLNTSVHNNAAMWLLCCWLLYTYLRYYCLQLIGNSIVTEWN